MDLWKIWSDFTQGNGALFLVLIGCVWLTLLFGSLSIVADGVGLFLGCSFVDIGGMLLTFLLTETGKRLALFVLVGLFFFKGVVCLLVSISLWIAKWDEDGKSTAKSKGIGMGEKSSAREINEYTRSRLQANFAPVDKGIGYRETVRLAYARKLLERVKDAPLSLAERMETAEIGGVFALLLEKENWNNAEYKRINELFARLLKLSAKYSVAV